MELVPLCPERPEIPGIFTYKEQSDNGTGPLVSRTLINVWHLGIFTYKEQGELPTGHLTLSQPQKSE